MAEERLVAGLRCTEVLARLSDYLDGELPPDDVARVEAHVAACDWCEQFGGRFAGVVTRLRRTLAPAPPIAPDVAARLAERLARGE